MPTQAAISLFLRALAKLRKATIIFVLTACLSVRLYARLSVRTEQLGSHWTHFYEILYLSIFRKSIKKIPVS
jgi:hypothetical protein